jgi:tRNA(Ile)-lysidine synthase
MDIRGLLTRCAFPEPGDQPLALGVSGGADSVAMAVLAAEANLCFEIWHVDHGLRATSHADVARVEALAGRLGVAFMLRTATLDDGPDLEARARAVRYSLLPERVCVAHTADDRAETVLMNLLRGAGPTGVRARFDRVNRPLLGLRRAETEAVCRWFGIDPVTDEHNQDPRFTRVRVRRELLPLVADIFDRDPVPILGRHADLVGGLLDWVDRQVIDLDPADVDQLLTAGPTVAGEALRRWIQQETNSDHPVDAAAITRVWSVVTGAVRAAQVTGGYRVSRSQGRLSISVASDHG